MSLFRTVFWLLLALSFSRPAVSTDYQANLILPLSGSQYYEKYNQWASLAQVAAINATQHWSTDRLTISIFDSQSDSALSSRLVIQSINNASVVAVIGFGDESATKEAARYLDAASMPLLSPSSRIASPLLSMLPHENYSSSILTSLIQNFGWTRFSAFYSFDGSVDEIKASLSSKPELDITWIRFPYMDPSGPAPSYSSTVQAFVKSGTTVGIILSKNPQEIASFLKEAELVRALGSGKAMVVVGAQSSSPSLASVPLGTIFIDELDSEPNSRLDFINFIQQISGFPQLGPGATLYPNSIQIYDAVFALVKAIDAAKSTQVTRPNILNALKSSDFVGYSGRVQFDSNGFRTALPANIANKQNSAFNIPIYYNGTHLIESAAPVFFGGLSIVPDDQIDLVPLVFFMPLSGPAAPFPRIVADLYIPFVLDAINNQPGLMPPNKRIAVLLYDDTNSPITAIQLGVPLPNLGIAGVIGSLISPMCVNIQNVVSPFNIPHLAFSANSPALSNKQLYPTFMRNVPPATFDIGAMIGLCKANNWKEVTVVYSEDQFGSGTIALIDQLVEAGITVEERISLPTGGASHYDEQVAKLQELSPKILLFLATFDTVKGLGNSLFKSGFKPDAWVATGSLLAGNLESTAQSFGAPITFFDGWIIVATSGGRGPKYDDFMAKVNAVPSPSQFDIVKAVLSVGSPYPVAIAESFYIYADSMRRVVEAGGDPRNGTEMIKAMYETNLEILTGPLSFDEHGDRIGPYDILNIKNAKFDLKGTWTSAEGMRLQKPLVFMDGTTNIPTSSYPRTRKWLFWTHAPGIVLAILAAIGLLTAIAMIFVIIHQRDAPPVASATWQFLVVMLLGIGLGYGSVFTWIGEPQPYICALRIWLPPMALILIMAPLLAKTWRLHRIFTLGSLKITPIPLWKLVVIAGTLISIQLIICIVWISLGTIHPENTDDTSKKTITYAVCSHVKANHIASYVTYGYFGFIMLIGAYYAFRVRNLPKDFNESRWIGFSIYNTILFGVIIIILGYALSSFPLTVIILICVCTLAISTGTLGLMLAPKIWTLWKHPEKRSGGSSDQTKTSSQIHKTTTRSHTKHDYSRRKTASTLTSKSTDS